MSEFGEKITDGRVKSIELRVAIVPRGAIIAIDYYATGGGIVLYVGPGGQRKHLALLNGEQTRAEKTAYANYIAAASLDVPDMLHDLKLYKALLADAAQDGDLFKWIDKCKRLEMVIREAREVYYQPASTWARVATDMVRVLNEGLQKEFPDVDGSRQEVDARGEGAD